MWNWLQGKLGITELKGRLEMADKKISDLKPVLDGINDGLTALGTKIDAQTAKLQQILANAANPSNPTTLTPDDQAALNAAVQEGSDISASIAAMSSKLSPADPAPADGTAASGAAS